MHFNQTIEEKGLPPQADTEMKSANSSMPYLTLNCDDFDP